MTHCTCEAVRTSAIVLPENPKNPVIMAGMGTGLAPWRAVTQDRIAQKRVPGSCNGLLWHLDSFTKAGIDVGPCMLFFGARYAKGEYLYREEYPAKLWLACNVEASLYMTSAGDLPIAVAAVGFWCLASLVTPQERQIIVP
eukprot:2926340-Amphidinium_carterae.1